MDYSSARTTLCFADFVLRTQPAGLQRAGVDVSLQSQPLRLLTLLVQRHGEIVTHDEIRQHLWGDIHVDFASGIHVCIRHIRRALDDVGATPKFVETVPRKGYRFVASVAEDASDNTRERTIGLVPARAKVAAIAAILVGIAWLYMSSGANDSADIDSAAPGLTREDAYLRARELLISGGKADAERARVFLLVAIEQNPDFAPAYASLAQAYEVSADYENARTYANKSIATDATYAGGYLRLAAIEAFGHWDWPAAEKNLERAMSLTPQQVGVHTALAKLYMITGRFDEARNAFEFAVSLDPTSAAAQKELGTFLYLRRKFEAAEQHCDTATRLEPHDYASRLCLYKLALVTKDEALAVKHALELVELVDADPHAIMGFDDLAPRQRIEAFETWRLAGYQRSMQSGDEDPVLLAVSYSVLRKFDESFYYLVKAQQERTTNIPLALFDPIFIPLWHQTNYLELAKDIGIAFDPDSAD